MSVREIVPETVPEDRTRERTRDRKRNRMKERKKDRMMGRLKVSNGFTRMAFVTGRRPAEKTSRVFISLFTVESDTQTIIFVYSFDDLCF